MSYLVVILWLVLSYIIGSLPFGYLIGKIFYGVDIRKLGSGNIGMANVYRNLGPKAGLSVLILDMLKGALPVLLASYLGKRFGLSGIELELFTVGTGVSAIAGHNWSVFLGFKGGKGIATSAGVLIVLTPVLLLIALALWFSVVLLTGYSSLGSIAGASLAIICAIMSLLNVKLVKPIIGSSKVVAGFIALISLIAIIRHRSNIKRLMEGTENKLQLFGKPKGEGNDAKGQETTT